MMRKHWIYLKYISDSILSPDGQKSMGRKCFPSKKFHPMCMASVDEIFATSTFDTRDIVIKRKMNKFYLCRIDTGDICLPTTTSISCAIFVIECSLYEADRRNERKKSKHFSVHQRKIEKKDNCNSQEVEMKIWTRNASKMYWMNAWWIDRNMSSTFD